MSGMNTDFTPKSIMVQEAEFFRFVFFCSRCDDAYTTGRIIAGNAAEARKIAEKEARPYFNLCHRCGQWVCDGHYNEDVMQCMKCAPRSRTHPVSKRSMSTNRAL